MLLFKDGMIVDGTGAPAYRGDVLVKDGRIAEVGTFERPAESETVDCAGLYVSPGFIDMHSHSDLQVLSGERVKPDQGVTTEVVGNCGFSAYPCGPDPKPIRDFANGIFCGDDQWSWKDARSYLADTAERAALVNVISLVGHGTLRIAHMGPRQGPPQPGEMDAMEQSLAGSLEAGSSGFSTGLMYAPGSSAPREELVALCRVVARHDKLYATHMRSYSFELLESIDEQLDLVRASGARLQISHLQAVGQKNWAKQALALEKLEQARDEGIDVAFDIYPYQAGSTVLTQLLPQWALDGGTPAMMARLTDPDERARIRKATLAQTAQQWENIFISAVGSATNESLVGKHLSQIGDERGVEPIDAAIDLLIEEQGAVNMLSFNQSEDNLRRLLTHPLCSVISDGFFVKGRPHPRLYGTFPFLLGEICRERKWMTLEDAVHRITAKPAARFGIKDRGRLAAGCHADLCVFDFEHVAGTATYENPVSAPVGIRGVYRAGKRIV
ncbi:MAG: N-acyl-D-amino-acid deacylase family protein [Bryobacteraceae bacterium]